MTDRIAIVSPPTTSRLDGDAKPPSSDGATRVRPSDVSVVELSKEKPQRYAVCLQVRLAPSGANGVEWSATFWNADLASSHAPIEPGDLLMWSMSPVHRSMAACMRMANPQHSFLPPGGTLPARKLDRSPQQQHARPSEVVAERKGFRSAAA